MKKMNRLITGLFALWALNGLADNAYRYAVDLTRVVNDKVSISLTVPDLPQHVIEFAFPAMVPGTYEVYDFGRFVSNFKAFGKNGAPITVEKVDVNTYRLVPANQLERITYDVDDTWDKTDMPNTKEKIVFEPGGTNFEDGLNFSINTHSMFGYFKGLTDRNFVLEFTKPKGFYPSTGLSDIKSGDTKDVLTVFDYHNLVDSPIMYSKPDTSSVQVGNTKVLVSVYSPNHKITSGFIAGTLRELLDVQKEYLGGELPVDKYAFLFYFMDKPSLSGSSGALEHSYSSFYTLPEFDSLDMQQQIRDVAAHEFFHIVTPLTIHSYEIGEFDFNHPKMSRHLWLYEGMTEYAAHHAQAKGGLIDLDQLLNTMMGKYENSLQQYNDTMSFTWMSKNVLDDKVHKQYGNVYEKGAVISMCLDILLRHYSEGKYGTQNLMKDLATKYGKNKSFNDGDLFKDIEAFTYPEIGDFLRTYVEGHSPLPMKEVMDMIGIEFLKEKVSYDFTFGGIDLNYNEKTERLFIESTANLDEFGKALGYKKGDELFTLNGGQLTVTQARDVVTKYYQTVKEGDIVKVEIYRPGKIFKKKYRKMTLSAPARKVKLVRTNQLSLKTDVTPEQGNTLKAWLGFN